MHTRLPCILPSHVPMVLSNSLSSLTKANASLPQIMSGYVTISINPAPKGKRKHKNTQGVKKKKWKWVEQWKREDKRCIIHVYRQILLEKKLNNYLCAKLMKALKCSLVLMPRWWLHVCSCSHAWIDSLNCMILQHNEGIWRNTNHCHLNAILKLAGCDFCEPTGLPAHVSTYTAGGTYYYTMKHWYCQIIQMKSGLVYSPSWNCVNVNFVHQQTYQLSRFGRVTHNFSLALTPSRPMPLLSRL